MTVKQKGKRKSVALLVFLSIYGQKKSIRHEVSNVQITVHWVGSPASQRVMCELQTSSSDDGKTEREEKVLLHSCI